MSETWGIDQPPSNGSARTHHRARRALRKKLEAQGYPPEEVRRQVEAKREEQRRSRVAQGMTKQPVAERPSWWSKNYPRRWSLAQRDGEVCHWCGADLDITIKGTKSPSPPRATLDHVVPRSAGGPNRLDNLVLSCQPCNEERGGVHGAGAFPGLEGQATAKGKRTLRAGSSAGIPEVSE